MALTARFHADHEVNVMIGAVGRGFRHGRPLDGTLSRVDRCFGRATRRISRHPVTSIARNRKIASFRTKV